MQGGLVERSQPLAKASRSISTTLAVQGRHVARLIQHERDCNRLLACMKFHHFKVVKHVHVHVTLKKVTLLVRAIQAWSAQSCDHNSDLGMLKYLCQERR